MSPTGKRFKVERTVVLDYLAATHARKKSALVAYKLTYYRCNKELPLGPYWPTVLMQKAVGPKMAFDTAFLTQVLRTELRFSTKSILFRSDTAILKINNCCQTICDWFMRVPGSWLARGWQWRHLGAGCF